MTFDRQFSMPNSHTFQMRPVVELLKQYIIPGMTVVDPFARDNKWATHANDLNPKFGTEYQMDAIDFCERLLEEKLEAHAVLFDPPYSPRQVKECYQEIGRKVTMHETQNGHTNRIVKDALNKILKPGGIAICFGWSSMGFGLKRGYDMHHIRLVSHGGAHNDTICTVERKQIFPTQLFDSELVVAHI